jgi:hypothetical protein
MKIKSYGDNFVPVIPYEHTERSSTKPFCWDDGCICREDREAIGKLNQRFEDGLITEKE